MSSARGRHQPSNLVEGIAETTHLDVERRVEAHLEVTLLVLGEDALEALLEDRHGERIGEDHVAVREVAERLHLEESDLVEASSEDVDGMTVLRCSPCERLVELRSQEIGRAHV